MNNWLIIGYWGVLILSFVLGIVEILMFGVSLKKMGGSSGMRKSLIAIFLASVGCITYSVAIAILSLKEISITENLWAIIPIGFLILSILYLIFSLNLKKSIKEISR